MDGVLLVGLTERQHSCFGIRSVFCADIVSFKGARLEIGFRSHINFGACPRICDSVVMGNNDCAIALNFYHRRWSTFSRWRANNFADNNRNHAWIRDSVIVLLGVRIDKGSVVALEKPLRGMCCSHII